MDEEHRHPELSRQQVALFERNPVCALCFDLCSKMRREYRSVDFDIMNCLEHADLLAEQIIRHPWNLDGLERYYNRLKNRYNGDKLSISCVIATLCTIFNCIEDLPHSIRELSSQLEVLLTDFGFDLYNSLTGAACRQGIELTVSSFCAPPPAQPVVLENEQLRFRNTMLERQIANYQKQLSIMQTTHAIQVLGNLYQGCTFTTNNNTNYFFGHVPSSSKSECSEAPSRDSVEKDSRTKRLFLTPDGDEDYTRTEEERNRFLNYLSDHHLSQRQIDCSRDNPINKAVVCFYAKWKHLRYVRPQTGPAPVLRFLTDTCALQRAAEERAISAILGKMLKSDYDPDIFYDVCDYFN